MKQILSKQLTNIVFLVLIVAAALAIYLLSRAESAPGAPIFGAVTATPTPSPTPLASETPKPRGIAESIWKTHLETSESFTANSSRVDPYAWTLHVGKINEVKARLFYGVENGCVSTLELSFKLPQPYKKSNSVDAIEQYQYETSKQQSEDLKSAMRMLLSDLFPTCDGEDRLQAATTRYWAEQALLLAKAGDEFEDTVEDCRFLAYIMEQDEGNRLVCCLFFE